MAVIHKRMQAAIHGGLVYDKYLKETSRNSPRERVRTDVWHEAFDMIWNLFGTCGGYRNNADPRDIFPRAASRAFSSSSCLSCPRVGCCCLSVILLIIFDGGFGAGAGVARAAGVLPVMMPRICASKGGVAGTGVAVAPAGAG